MKTKIESASLLDQIKDLFFKGLDGLLGAAADYQNDMGKLKGVYNIPVKTADGKEHTVKISLSPIKDKDGIFYVEVESDADITTAGVNQKTFKIDKENKDAFNKVVDKLLKDNGLERVTADPEDTSQDGTDEEGESASDSFEDVAQDSGEPSDDGSEFRLNVADDVNNAIYTVVLKIYEDDKNLTLEIEGEAPKPLDYSPFNRDDNKFESVDKMDRWVKNSLESFLDLNSLRLYPSDKKDGDEEYEYMIEASNRIEVSLEKITSSSGVDVNLVAINAGSVLGSALSTLESVVADDDFVDSMPEGVSSYSISEDNDEYDVQQIYDVDTSSTPYELFKEATQAYNNLCSINWTLSGLTHRDLKDGIISIGYTIREDIDRFALLMIDDTKSVPNCSSLNCKVVNITGDESEQDIINVLRSVVKDYVNALDTYYVNVPQGVQSAIDEHLCYYNSFISDLDKSK